MTQDEIIRFAIQCRLVTTGNRDGLYMDALTEFAKLVAAKEREALAQKQEPVAWQFMNGSHFRKRRPDDFADLDSDGLPYWKPLYTTPPQRTEQEPVIGKWSLREVYFDEDGEPISHRSPPQRTEQNFCSRCGKRVGGIDSIHTCTPPMEMNT